jgi:flagellar biosynthesis anti-sigma factor FlgM
VRIDSNVPVPNNGQPERTSETRTAGPNQSIEQSGGGQGGNAPMASDLASISVLATQLGNFPAVRQGRVAALRQAVRTGSYQIDAGQVAQSMLGEMFGAGSKS